ncbi:MAG: immunoglobulin domain-containing protein [Limisphaerales bacterium]
MTNWPSWIASYNGQNVQSGGPTSSFPWPTWNVWQYDDTNWSGGDSDVLKGGYANLEPLVIGGLPPGPFITQQPVVQRAVDTGSNVTFTATALGRSMVQYQWQLNGTNIFNATGAAFTVNNAQLTDAGNYTFITTDATGSVTSSPVSLVVYPPQVAVFADNFEVNSAANWILNKSSADTAVTFSYDYSALGIPSAPHSTGGTTSRRADEGKPCHHHHRRRLALAIESEFLRRLPPAFRRLDQRQWSLPCRRRRVH